jgi:hypothetical protein
MCIIIKKIHTLIIDENEDEMLSGELMVNICRFEKIVPV